MGEFSSLKVMESFWRLSWKEFAGISFLNLALYGLMCVIVVHLCFYLYARVTGKKVSLYYELLWMAFLVYVVFICHITILGREPGSRKFVIDTTPLMFHPYSVDQNMTNFLNIVLFVPLGILLMMITGKVKGLYRLLIATLYCFTFSVFIEFTQLFTGRGFFELDDVEANSLGGFCGAALVVLISCVLHRKPFQAMGERRRK